MSFEHRGLVFNLLDTPGHEDFSEDTYRTLTAVDSAIMVIDAAKGIEAQTRKLFEVCRLRDMPIITFINKIDREGRDPFELLDEIEQTLALDVAPVTWPVGMGDRRSTAATICARDRLLLPSEAGEAARAMALRRDRRSGARPSGSTRTRSRGFREGAELALRGLSRARPRGLSRGPPDARSISAARSRTARSASCSTGSPHAAPPPRPQPAEPRAVDPDEPEVTGFIFKVQANMDPNHRDRVAFMRVCSGRFRRGMKLRQARTGKSLAVHSPIFFFAQDRELAEEAWPGDIIGIPNHGTLRVGDTLTEGEDLRFTGIPNFAPGDPAPGAPRRSDAGQAAQARARGPRRGGRDPGVPAARRRAAGSSAWSGRCSSTC